MAVDPYAPCPCGSGKKVKFCCSDLVGDIEKIHRMIEGDQPRAALRHAEQTLAKHPGRASLLDLKATLELALGETDAARATIDEFLKVDPQNPSAHACQAMLLASTEGGTAAVAPLQKALGADRARMPQRVFEAIGVVGRALLERRAHRRGAGASVAARGARAEGRSAGARAAGEFEPLFGLAAAACATICGCATGRPTRVGRPRRKRRRGSRIKANGNEAADDHRPLGGKHGAEPTLLYNRAVLAGRLADDRALVAGLHAYRPDGSAARRRRRSRSDCPTARQRSQRADARLGGPRLRDQGSTTRWSRSLPPTAACSRSTSIPRGSKAAISRGRGTPTCCSTSRCRNRASASSAAQVPSLAGVISIFGRQTNRPERLELTTDQWPEFRPHARGAGRMRAATRSAR